VLGAVVQLTRAIRNNENGNGQINQTSVDDSLSIINFVKVSTYQDVLANLLYICSWQK